MILKLWFDMTEEQWQEERKRIRELQDRHFREKGDGTE